MTIDHFDTPYKRQVAIWILRLLATDLTKFLPREGGYADSDVAQFLGLPSLYDPSDVKTVPQMMEQMLLQLLAAGDASLGNPATGNLKSFAEQLGLDAVGAAILAPFVVCECNEVFRDSLRLLRNSFTFKTSRVLSKMLEISEAEVSACFQKGSRFLATGVLRKSAVQSASDTRWQFFSEEVATKLMREPYDHSRLLISMGVLPTDAPLLELGDYPHLHSELRVLLAYLHEVKACEKRGVNILLHGDPGTGKTQLGRVIAKEIGMPLYEFATHDSDGEPIDMQRRLVSGHIAECFFTHVPALFMFDEFEDIITPSGTGRGHASEHKGWFNRMLETNLRPILWLSNSIRHLDAAFVRRFDFIIEVPVPPRSQRGNILRKHAGQHLSNHVIDRLAEIDSLAPAVITRVTEVFDAVSKTMTQDGRDESFVQMVGSVLKAQGHSVPSRASDEILPTDVYDTCCLNTGADLPGIARMLRTHPQARICLHGPPGTGKTAFGHWLAREIDRPLHVKRASDLLSPFVGGTEMRIANTFEKAIDDDAILMIDEVDSFLQDRTKAVRSWEVTQVNELLTRMEAFQGVFIATTNRLEHLDAASLRRFDLKLGFDYLAPSQIRELLRAWCLSLGIAPATTEDHGMIESLECVTPGDFAAVARRHRFQPMANAGAFAQALIEDCAMKTEHARRIGFV